MKIYGDTNSGNCLKVKWVCDALALPYTWIDVDTLKRETRTAAISQAQQRRPGADGRIRRRPHAGGIQRHHPLPRARQRSDPSRRVCGGQDGRMAVLGTIQPRALCRGLPLPDEISGQAGLRSRSRQGQARLRGAGADGASAYGDAVSLVGDSVSLADVSLLAYTRLAHEGGFHLDGYASLRRWIGEAERALGAGAGALGSIGSAHGRNFRRYHPPRAPRRRRRHRRDAGGRSARQRARTDRRSAAAVLFPGVRGGRAATRTSSSWSRKQGGAVVGCLQLCILPGLSSQGASRALIEDVRVASALPQPRHRRAIGAMGGRASARQGMQAGRVAHAQHPRRCAAILQAARISAEPCRDDLAILTQSAVIGVGPAALQPIAKPALQFNPVNAG